MRSAVFLRHPMKHCEAARFDTPDPNTSWRTSHLATNLIWLYFLLHELYTPALKDKASFDTELAKNHLSSNASKLKKRRLELNDALGAVAERLSPGNWEHSGFTCTRDLIGWALDQGWLDLEDVRGEGDGVDNVATQLNDLSIRG